MLAAEGPANSLDPEVLDIFEIIGHILFGIFMVEFLFKLCALGEPCRVALHMHPTQHPHETPSPTPRQHTECVLAWETCAWAHLRLSD